MRVGAGGPSRVFSNNGIKSRAVVFDWLYVAGPNAESRAKLLLNL